MSRRRSATRPGWVIGSRVGDVLVDVAPDDTTPPGPATISVRRLAKKRIDEAGACVESLTKTIADVLTRLHELPTAAMDGTSRELFSRSR